MHILLTRAERDSYKLARALQGLGHQISMVPLLEIQPLDEEAREQRLAEILAEGKADGVICISKNSAIWGLPPLLKQWPTVDKEAEWFALGGGTAEVLHALGVEAVAPSQAQSEGLLNMPELQEVSGRRLLYVAGENGRPTIETELVSRGAEVLRWDVYRRRPDQAAAEELLRLADVPDVLTVMSADSLLALDQAVPEPTREEWLVKLLVVPSQRVANLADKMGFLNINVVPVSEKDWPMDYLASL